MSDVDGQVRDSEQLDPEAEARRRHARAPIGQYPDPALKLAAKPVERFDDDLRRLADRMVGLMREAHGVGLAGTQVGILRRLFVFDLAENESRAIANPTIVTRHDETRVEDEGCLSLQGVRVPVERAIAVTIEGQDPAGDAVRWDLEGLPARVVQHELDHLDGVLILDRTDDESRKRALATLRPQPILR
jgi:peptide deformylase